MRWEVPDELRFKPRDALVFVTWEISDSQPRHFYSDLAVRFLEVVELRAFDDYFSNSPFCATCLSPKHMKMP